MIEGWLLPTFHYPPHVKQYEHPMSSTSYFYLGMNNRIINSTWRKAISFAIDYSHIIQELQDGFVVRAYSPISEGLLIFLAL